jgi:hypothetical protein
MWEDLTLEVGNVVWCSYVVMDHLVAHTGDILSGNLGTKSEPEARDAWLPHH